MNKIEKGRIKYGGEEDRKARSREGNRAEEKTYEE